MKQRDRRAWIVFAAAALFVGAVIWFLPVNISQNIRVPGKIFAKHVWSLERSGQGTLHAQLENRSGAVTDRYLVQTIERGDVAEFVLSPRLRLGANAIAGDTIGVLASALFDRELTDKSTSINVLASEARTFSEGAKAAEIDEAKTRLQRTRERLALQERIVSRLRALQVQGAVATDEVDRAEREEVSLRGRIAVTESEIAVLESGARLSEQQLAASRLGAGREQLYALERQRESFVIRTPISGLVTRPSSDSVLVRIVDTSTWIAAIAVPVPLRHQIASGDSVSVTIEGVQVSATALHVGQEVAYVAGVASVVVTCELDATDTDLLLDGLLVEAAIATRPIRLRDRVRAEFAGLFRWRDWWGNATRV